MMADMGTRLAKSIGVVVLAVCLPQVAAVAACKLGKFADLPVTMENMQPIVTAQINGREAHFLADSGAIYSLVTTAGAAEFGLKTFRAPFDIVIEGVGGDSRALVTNVKVFTLAGAPLRDIRFIVGGGEPGNGNVGILGQNVFRLAGDVEYDLAKGVIRLMREDGCSSGQLASLVAGPGQAYSIMDVQPTTPQAPHTMGTAIINGISVRVLFDTGAGTSFISARAAERAGIKLDAQGVAFAGYSQGLGREMVKTWIAPVASFKVGDEEIRNTRLRVGESLLEFTDMLIGADFFLSHHLYLARGQHKLFFSYNGGPVFNLTSSALQQPAAGPAVNASAENSAKLASSETKDAVPGPTDAAAEPNDAAAFSRRGAASAARRDFVHAIADLNRACELAPSEPDYFYERGIAYRQSGQANLAMADFDQVIKLKPDHVPALVARAEIHLTRKEYSLVVDDLNAADRSSAKEADVRLRMAFAYAHADHMEAAVTQLDSWILAHGGDARMTDAIGERCFAAAHSGQDLKRALDDCNSTLKHLDQSSLRKESILESRGLVRLSLGDNAKAIDDLDASLALQAKNAWALYARGVAKLRSGKTSDGEADKAAAAMLAPRIEYTFKQRGIEP